MLTSSVLRRRNNWLKLTVIQSSHFNYNLFESRFHQQIHGKKMTVLDSVAIHHARTLIAILAISKHEAVRESTFFFVMFPTLEKTKKQKLRGGGDKNGNFPNMNNMCNFKTHEKYHFRNRNFKKRVKKVRFLSTPLPRGRRMLKKDCFCFPKYYINTVVFFFFSQKNA